MSDETADKPNISLGHGPSVVLYNGETWKIVCACGWECWDAEDEEDAWDAFNDHVFWDDLRTMLARMRNERGQRLES
jgi:hypothetical protein